MKRPLKSLTAVGLIAIAMLIATPLKAQSTASQPVVKSASLIDWQTAAGGKMEFEVASVREDPSATIQPPSVGLGPDDGWGPAGPPGGLFTADFFVGDYIAFAYKLNWDQRKLILASLPKWASAETFAINARSESRTPTKDQMRLMMQSLLADRFKLAVHFETQDLPVLALTLAKSGKTGTNLRPHFEGQPCDVPAPPTEDQKTTNIQIFPPTCDGFMSKPPGIDHKRLVGGRDIPWDSIPVYLSAFVNLGHPLVDRTGLGGKFDFTLEWTTEIPTSGDVQPDPQGTTLLVALQEQLGLKLELKKAPLQVLVIDHVEKPSEN